MEKLTLEHKSNYPIDVIVALAVNAKNSLHGWIWLLPKPIGLWKYSYFTIHINKWTASNGGHSKKIIEKHLNVTAESRKASRP